MKNRDQNNKRRSSLYIVSIALMTTAFIGGCKWDSELYDTFVNEEDMIEPCPEMTSLQLRSNRVFTEDECGTVDEYLENAGLTSRDCQLSFEHKICPSGFVCKKVEHKDKNCIDENGNDFCVEAICTAKICSKDQVYCAGECIDPTSNNIFCGASGDCLGTTVQGGSKGTVCKPGEQCTNGECEPACAENEVFCDGKCRDPMTDDQYCNAARADDSGTVYCSKETMGFNCSKDGRICVNGKCEMPKCQGRQVLCDDVCRDPMSDMDFCGAEGKNTCDNRGVKCQDGRVCINGECKQNSCSGETHSLCVINGENECIDLKNSNPEHCGSCNYKCSDHPVNAASSDTCVEDRCLYRCNDGYINCNKEDADEYPDGRSFNPNCVLESNFQTDSNNCGGCGIVCSEKEYCSSGKCVVSKCFDSGSCLNTSTGTCVNEASMCGVHCIDCNAANNAELGQCTAGECKILKCAVGYHMVQDANGNIGCEMNTVENCGLQDSMTTENCNEYNAATAGICSNGVCVATLCKSGYHLENGICIEDSIEKCGNSLLNCNSLPGWNNGTCTNGVCLANSCITGYCYNKEFVCVAGNNSTSSCGIKGDACDECANKQVCVYGLCSTDPCIGEGGKDNNICYYNASVCENTNTHCGTSCINCNTANNASLGTCDNGVCVIKACAPGYHLKQVNGVVSCEINVTTVCGKMDSLDTLDCNTYDNARSGVCTDGECSATSCAQGFHLKNGKCVADSVEECGNELINCKKLAGWVNGSCSLGHCVAKECDNSRFCVYNGECVDGSRSTVSCGTDGGMCKTCSGTDACVNGECNSDPCIDKGDNICYHNSQKCENGDSYCGVSCVDCNTANHASKGICSGGKCTISACSAGYHLYTIDGVSSCEADSLSACGALRTTCNLIDGWSSGICGKKDDRVQCIATNCKPGYHNVNGKCVADSTTACGIAAQDCTKLTGWKDAECDAVNHVCKALSCKDDYCLQNGVCVSGTSNQDACGITGGECIKCQSDQVCMDGECGMNLCANSTTGRNTCNYNGQICENADTHCGMACVDCNTANHASKGTCVSGGVCTIQECAVGYHIVSTNGVYSCEANTNAKCGSTFNASLVYNCNTSNNAVSGVCSQDKDGQPVCTATTCKDNYHPYAGGCELNTVNHCGKHGNVCGSKLSDDLKENAVFSCSDGECTYACGAKSHKYNDGCEADSSEHCGYHSNDCGLLAGWENGECSDAGICNASQCKTGYHVKANICLADTRKECGTNKDTGKPYDCTSLVDGNYVCVDGGCILNNCEENVCLTSGKCENKVNRCGAMCLNCNVENHAASGLCNSATGSCVVKSCAAGYHLTMKKESEDAESVFSCELNTNVECGSATEANSIVDCTSANNAADGVCASDGTCVIMACVNGFSLENGVCKDNQMNPKCCGDDCIDCIKDNAAKDGTCVDGKCIITKCLEGHHISETLDTCDYNTDNSCGLTDGHAKNCQDDEHVIGGFCKSDGNCYTTICKDGYVVSRPGTEGLPTCVNCDENNPCGDGLHCMDGLCRCNEDETVACSPGLRCMKEKGKMVCKL